MTGTGHHSQDGRRGVSNVQTNNLVRLFFGSVWNPSNEYHLTVDDLSQVGQLVLYVIDHCDNGQEAMLPGGMEFIKNDVYAFANSSFRKTLYLYCPTGDQYKSSKQYLTSRK